MCMDYALLQKNAVHDWTMWKSAYGGNASQANNKLSYQFTTSPFNILYCDV